MFPCITVEFHTVHNSFRVLNRKYKCAHRGRFYRLSRDTSYEHDYRSRELAINNLMQRLLQYLRCSANHDRFEVNHPVGYPRT
jgi:hypothetical protein